MKLFQGSLFFGAVVSTLILSVTSVFANFDDKVRFETWQECRSEDGAWAVEVYTPDHMYPSSGTRLTVKQRWSIWGLEWMQTLESSPFQHEVRCGRALGLEQPDYCEAAVASRFALVTYDRDPFKADYATYLFNRQTGEKVSVQCERESITYSRGIRYAEPRSTFEDLKRFTRR